MRQLLALVLVSLLACRDSTRPIDTPLFGAYALTTIDGNALPYSVTIDGEPTVIRVGDLRLDTPNMLSLSLMLGAPGSPTTQSIAMTGLYRRVTADSVVFPMIATPEFFIKRTGRTVVLVSEPSGSVLSPAAMIGGAHRLTFVELPHTTR